MTICWLSLLRSTAQLPRPLRVAVLLLLFVPLPGIVAEARAELTVTLTPTSISASGATQGATIIFFGAGLATTGYDAAPVHLSEAVTAGSDGVATLTVAQGIPWKSIWVAADLTTGRYSLATPASFPLHRTEAAGISLMKAKTGEVTRLQRSRPTGMVLYLQPGVAAFFAALGDGSSSDADGRADGKATFDVTAMTRIAGRSDASRFLQMGALVFMIDTQSMDITVVSIDATALAAAI